MLLFAVAFGLSGCATTNVGALYPAAGERSTPVKDILVTIDGTGNSQISRTNAARLFELVDANSAKRTAPLATYYAEGVGSRGEILGLATGKGIGTDVRQAYDFLTRTYHPKDRITLSGFSRGAYPPRPRA